MRAGLVGYPAEHSLSPALFDAAYPGSGYTYDIIDAKSWKVAWRTFLEGYDAVNVTAPYKVNACLSADVRDRASGLSGASNLLVKRDGKIHAYNTDFIAVKRIIARFAPQGTDDWIVVFGCGGAGRAAALAAADLDLRTFLVDRTFERAAEFASGFGDGLVFPVSLDDFESVGNAVSQACLVIYALPVSLDVVQAGLNPDFSGKTVLEANYRNPSLSACSGRYISGLNWLLEQARAGFPLITGKNPDVAAMRRVLLKR
ncbi:MAG: hypothetical protein LKK19_06065 [Bacteroidales bacterium]|jgi:shikimate dehydrogenase|nr:hypothetical protein [Bacteroidales bacterium]MCI2122252.1 hypothetical protein [Bacteroidales bacterium]MCI2145300.1 hypothetical protein [Bacteroidales bacterium]